MSQNKMHKVTKQRLILKLRIRKKIKDIQIANEIT